MLKYLLFISFFISVYVSYSQTDEFFNEFKGTFDTNTQNDIDKVVQEIKSCEQKNMEADKLFESGEVSKSLSILKKSSNVFETDYRELFMLFDGKLSGLLQTTEGIKKDYCSYRLSEARNLFRLSISQRLSAEKEKLEKKAYKGYTSAHENEVNAVNALCHIFALISGKVEEDMTLKEEDSNIISDQLENTVTDNFVSRSFTVKGIEIPTNFSFNVQTDQNNTVDNSTNNNSDNQNNNSSSNNHKNYNGNSNQGSSSGHEFRIQIGTSILPANDWQLKQINKTDLEVKTFKSKIYYKYTVGSFSSFQEAKNYKNAYGLSQTYIVEYNNGIEIKFYYGNVQ
jgi:hypothetical protein